MMSLYRRGTRKGRNAMETRMVLSPAEFNKLVIDEARQTRQQHLELTGERLSGGESMKMARAMVLQFYVKEGSK
jgi:ABC-type transport system involved in cytochrome bd biosynthesis fused ATPase/permease subunit